MTVEEIQKDIKKEFGSGFISQKQALSYLGFAKDAGRSFLSQLPVYPTQKKKLYSALDVARLIDSKKTFKPYGSN